MTVQHVDLPLDQETADHLAARFHRCFETFEPDDELFSPDVFLDLLPPYWRFQLQGPDVFVGQLRAIAEGPSTVRIIRTVPTATGFVTEHQETQETVDGPVTARRIHLCEVSNGRITEVVTYCNGGWNEELRARHAAEAPMLRQ